MTFVSLLLLLTVLLMPDTQWKFKIFCAIKKIWRRSPFTPFGFNERVFIIMLTERSLYCTRSLIADSNKIKRNRTLNSANYKPCANDQCTGKNARKKWFRFVKVITFILRELYWHIFSRRFSNKLAIKSGAVVWMYCAIYINEDFIND